MGDVRGGAFGEKVMEGVRDAQSRGITKFDNWGDAFEAEEEEEIFEAQPEGSTPPAGASDPVWEGERYPDAPAGGDTAEATNTYGGGALSQRGTGGLRQAGKKQGLNLRIGGN